MAEATRSGGTPVVPRWVREFRVRGKQRRRAVDRAQGADAPRTIPSAFAGVDVSTKFDGSGTSVRFSGGGAAPTVGGAIHDP